MALRLNAEQKYIADIFSGKTEYIIPPYQRAYSWDKESCEVLFDDLQNAFLTNGDQGYFLGNIVLAKSNEKRNSLEVIDGQQRLITLTLLIKALSSFLPKNIDLKSVIWINDSEGNATNVRLKTKVFEEKDAKFLNEVITIPTNELKLEKDENNNFKINIKYFYEKLVEFKKVNNLDDFADFILNYVSILPIESEDSIHKEARKKALKIFETINNRGMALSNADIFKAELYSMALNDSKDDEFINRWKDLDRKCDEQKYSLDRIFKIYSYQIRGQKGIKSSEIGLRDFFDTKNNISPFNYKTYNEIMNDLNDIIVAVEFFNNTKQKTNYNELPKWFQLIDEYTNNYPKDLIIVYLAKCNNGNYFIEDEVINFSKSLVRYCYFQGATTTIKYYIYDLTIKVMHDSWEVFYPEHQRDYQFFGRLYRGFALLLAYLHPEQKSVYPYNIVKLRNILNYYNPKNSWFDLIGNNIPMDITEKELIGSDKKSSFIDVEELKNKMYEWNDTLHLERQKMLQQRLKYFFENPNAN